MTSKKKKAKQHKKHFEQYLKTYGLEGAAAIWANRGWKLPAEYEQKMKAYRESVADIQKKYDERHKRPGWK